MKLYVEKKCAERLQGGELKGCLPDHAILMMRVDKGYTELECRNLGI